MSSPSNSRATQPVRSEPSSGPDVVHLVRRRGLRVPEEDRGPLTDYWAHITALRAEVDEDLLADNEMALTWTAVDPDAR